MPTRTRNPLTNLPLATLIGVAALVIGIIGGVGGYVRLHPGPFNPADLLRDFYANLSSELVNIGFAILVIDAANHRRDEKERKRATIEQMGSPVNDAAREAARIVARQGWLRDGSLRGVDFRQADLRHAVLQSADLSGADLHAADLSGAKLQSAKLRGANLWDADLEGVDLSAADLGGANLYRADLGGADLRFASLCGANLRFANRKDANLHAARFDADTLLPDEPPWNPSVDMARYTHSKHRHFWRPRQRALVERWDGQQKSPPPRKAKSRP